MSVNWKERALAAEAERDEARADAKRLRKREEHFARALSVADGGQYRNDWDGALRRLLAERDEARRLLAAAARGELPRCNECERAATRRWIDAPGGVCDACAAKASADDARALEDLPLAAAIRTALEAAP